MIDSEKAGLDILTEKILKGMQIANRKLVESAATEGRSLIVGDENGNPISVPAKELLKQMQIRDKEISLKNNG